MIFLLVLGGMLACTGKLAEASCVLQMSPHRAVVRYGDSLSANCSSTSEIEGIGWESSLGGTGLQIGVSSLPLNIKSVETWEFEPQCYANLLSNGEQCISPLPITVYKMPNSVSISPVWNGEEPMVEGRQYQVFCDVVNVAPLNKLVVHWYKDKEIIFTNTSDDPRPTPVNISYQLDLTAQRNDTGTEIYCKATLELGSTEENPPPVSSEPQALIVLSPPMFDKPSNETVELPPGKTISLDCTATGNPTPAYRWHFPDPTVEANRQQDVSQPILTPAFPVPGTYVCTASNSLGNRAKYFSVVGVSGTRTTLAAILGVFVTLGGLLLISGLFCVTQNGTFSFNKNSYIPGQPTSSAPV